MVLVSLEELWLPTQRLQSSRLSGAFLLMAAPDSEALKMEQLAKAG